MDKAVEAFELIAEEVQDVPLGPRRTPEAEGLIHPEHQRLIVYEWEVNPS